MIRRAVFVLAFIAYSPFMGLGCFVSVVAGIVAWLVTGEGAETVEAIVVWVMTPVNVVADWAKV